MRPVRDKVMGRERNLQGSSSSHGAAPGAQYVPLGAARRRKQSARQLFALRLSQGQGHGMRKKSARQLFPSRLSREPGIPFLLSVLLLLAFY